MIDAETDGVIKLTHKNREPSIVPTVGTHPPAKCNHANECDARDYCGHAKEHTKELMYDNCSGHYCTYKGEFVKCMPTQMPE